MYIAQLPQSCVVDRTWKQLFNRTWHAEFDHFVHRWDLFTEMPCRWKRRVISIFLDMFPVFLLAKLCVDEDNSTGSVQIELAWSIIHTKHLRRLRRNPKHTCKLWYTIVLACGLDRIPKFVSWKSWTCHFGRCRACHDLGCLGISPCSELCTFLLCWPEVFLAKEGWEIWWNVHPGGAKMNSPADWLNFLKKPGISATFNTILR